MSYVAVIHTFDSDMERPIHAAVSLASPLGSPQSRLSRCVNELQCGLRRSTNENQYTKLHAEDNGSQRCLHLVAIARILFIQHRWSSHDDVAGAIRKERRSRIGAITVLLEIGFTVERCQVTAKTREGR